MDLSADELLAMAVDDPVRLVHLASTLASESRTSELETCCLYNFEHIRLRLLTDGANDPCSTNNTTASALDSFVANELSLSDCTGTLRKAMVASRTAILYEGIDELAGQLIARLSGFVPNFIRDADKSREQDLVEALIRQAREYSIRKDSRALVPDHSNCLPGNEEKASSKITILMSVSQDGLSAATVASNGLIQLWDLGAGTDTCLDSKTND
eukprot:UC4_evm1s218